MHLFIQRQWNKNGLWAWALSPLSLVVCLAAWSKRKLYQFGWIKAKNCGAPLIVVGNLTVGGAGKTPLVIYLCKRLQAAGFKPGVISRGYKSQAAGNPVTVTPDSDPAAVGDEPVLIARRCDCPVLVGRQRLQSAQQLVREQQCDVIISDDGFQHLKLDRDIDILVSDAQRGYGNGWCLPSGPMRESLSALKAADLLVSNGAPVTPGAKAFSMQLASGEPYALNTATKTTFAALQQRPVHAVAGIGNPKRFFDQLKQHGLNITEHAFPDHYAFSASDFSFDDQHAIIMTEKDAVKCQHLSLSRAVWVLPVEAQLSTEFDAALLDKLNASISNTHLAN